MIACLDCSSILKHDEHVFAVDLALLENRMRV